MEEHSDIMKIAQTYLNVFESSAEGRAIFEDLEKAYGDRLSHTSGDPYETAFKEGQRDVFLRIKHLIELAKRGEE